MTAKLTHHTPIDPSLWSGMIEFNGSLSATAARALLKLRFSDRDHDRMRVLSAKARSGTLTEKEEQEINTYEQVGCFLGVVHSKARRALKARVPARS